MISSMPLLFPLWLLVVGVVHADPSPYALPRDPHRPRNDVGPPIASYLLPGFDQWWEGQYVPALGYSATAGVGLGLVLSSASRINGSLSRSSLTSRSPEVRQFLLGNILYAGAGGLSAHHSFRSSVYSTRPTEAGGSDPYAFLTHEESPGDILVSPFRFDYLARVTTLAPLALAVTLTAYWVRHESIGWSGLTVADTFYAGSFSFLAGTNEEAAFRGWIMPVVHRTANYNPWISNGVSSGIFAAAHYDPSSKNIPWPQFLIGVYLGWLSQYREWTLSEGIFVHTWWDVIAFAASYAFRESSSSAATTQPTLYFPPVQLRF